jgi:hypothetical protein
MGDVHIPQPEPNKVGAKVAELIASGHELYATTLTGHPSGRVRRPTLFLIAGIATLMTLLGWSQPWAALVAFIAIMLLALTDSVVDLTQ